MYDTKKTTDFATMIL